MSAETTIDTPSLLDTISEARRQTEICNACRYCEGYCAVFPAITRQRAFADADIIQLANPVSYTHLTLPTTPYV